MIVIPFVDLQKISLFPKFGGCGSKIEPATPISILNFSRVWQSFKVSYALQILVNDRFFIGLQKIDNFAKLRGCGSKIEPATPI